MILTAPHLIRAIRWIPPGVTILGSSCSFLNFWAAIRALTWPFPRWVYTQLDQMLYSNYQAMVGFWYETWSGVEVRELLQLILLCGIDLYVSEFNWHKNCTLNDFGYLKLL